MHASLQVLALGLLPITALAAASGSTQEKRAAPSLQITRRQSGCYEGTDQICYGQPGGTAQDIDPLDLEYIGYAMREEAKLADGDNIYLTMPVTGLVCEEWTIKTETTTMLLVKHNSPRKPAKVLWTDIADSIDGGGEGGDEEKKKGSILGCGESGGQIDVQVDERNELYNTEAYKSGGFTFDVVIKAVRAP